MTRETCVITGATSGIGRALALQLAARDRTVILLGRDAGAGAAVLRSIRRHSPSAQAEFIRVDLADQGSVAAAARDLAERHEWVDHLINNAGARYDQYLSNRDGIELSFATNHLGHFQLTSLLLGALRRAPTATVINVASSAAAQARNDGRWILRREEFDRRQAYAKSKLANIVFSFDAAARLRGSSISVVAVDPGLVATRFASNNGPLAWLKHVLYHGLRRELISASSAAADIVHLLAAPAQELESGGYFKGRRPAKACAAAYAADPASLWELSLGLLHQRAPAEAAWAR